MKKSFKRLVIDSATKFLYVGLFEDEKSVFSYYREGNNDHSINLMLQIEKGLKEQQLTVADIDEIIIGIGPGSYTGLRIGVVVAKMFGWNNDIPVKTISSLALMASSYQGESLILSEIDARRGNSFLGVFQVVNNTIVQVFEEELTNLEEYKNNLKETFEVVSNGEPDISKILHSDLLKEIKDIHALNPNYLRVTEAERNLNN